MRDTTERSEAVVAGNVKLEGTSVEKIFIEVSKLLNEIKYYESMTKNANPYGDCTSCHKIVELIKAKL